MIAPLRPFAIRGVIWYQGEGNVGNPAGYERMLPALIGDVVPFHAGETLGWRFVA